MTAARCRSSRTLLLYAQDNQGLGHVTRTLTIARHLLAAYPDTVAYIATRKECYRRLANDMGVYARWAIGLG